MPSFPVSNLIYGLARDAVQIQRRLDAAYEENLVRALPATAVAAPVLGEAVRAMLPQRQVVSSFELDCRLRLRTERTVGVSIGATVLSFSYDARFGRAETAESRVQLTVQQTPVIPEPNPQPQ